MCFLQFRHSQNAAMSQRFVGLIFKELHLKSLIDSVYRVAFFFEEWGCLYDFFKISILFFVYFV